MPVQYPMGVMAEHLWTREHCGIFDVSHMGQARLRDVARGAESSSAERGGPARRGAWPSSATAGNPHGGRARR
eukprot:gene63898-87393_t